MNRKWIGWTSGLVGISLALAATVCAAQGAAEPQTLWSFLGITHVLHKGADAHLNRKGNHPGHERKPLLKALADPENLKSGNPAIKKAAEIKTDQDLAPQKVKAIKYLSLIACGCYPGVREALLAALDDCTEEVRYEAAMAFCRASGNPCNVCAKGSCCSPEVVKKLRDMAEGMDSNGCCKEPSQRVREAAAMAANACLMQMPVTPLPETPLPVPERIETPNAPLPEGQPRPAAPVPTPAPPRNPTTDAPRQTPAESVSIRKVSGESDIASDAAEDTSAVLATDRLALAAAGPFHHRRPAPCPREPAALPEAAAPAPTPPEVPSEPQPSPPPDTLAGSFGATAGPESAGPNMIGDFNGLSSQITVQYDDGAEGTVNVPIAGGDRRFKVSEDNNPIPTDRLFFDYNHFANTALAADDQLHDLNRFTFGLEKTFLDGLVSLELRLPFAEGLNSVQSFEPGAGLTGSEFGNIPLVFKCLALQTERHAVGMGVAAVLPTANDGRVRDDFGRDLLVVRNQAVHLEPFIGWLWTPNDKLFVMAFGQIDFDTRGNDVLVPDFDPSTQARTMRLAGVYHDQNLGYADLKIGRWLYRNREAHWLTGIAPTIELHYATTLQDTDEVAGVTNPANRVDVLDLTGGLHIELCERSTLTVAGSAPLRLGSDRVYDGEVMVQFNRRF